MHSDSTPSLVYMIMVLVYELKMHSHSRDHGAHWSDLTLSSISLACQTFHSAKGEEKSGNLPIPFWFAEFGIILCHINGMLLSFNGHLRVGFGRGLFYQL